MDEINTGNRPRSPLAKMKEKTLPRLSRLTAILTQLQTKRLVTATELAKKFGVSIRTIYRDVRALEASGIPIFTEEGKGYALRGRLPAATGVVHRKRGQCVDYCRTVGALQQRPVVY